MAEIICHGKETRHALERDVNQLVDTVKITIGPGGRNVVLDKKFDAPLITNDSVTITKEIELDDPFRSMGAQLVKEISTKINDAASGGTTTATLLAQAIIRKGLKNLTAGANPMAMKKSIIKATTTAIEATRVSSKKVNGSADIARVSTVSSSDETVGKPTTEAMEKVSHDGIIAVEGSRTTGTYSEVVKGIQSDRGYITPYTATDTEKMEAVLDDTLILVTDKRISSTQELLPILEQAVQSGKKLLVIAKDVESKTLSTLIVNKLRGTLDVVCVKAPGFSDRRKEMLEGIAVLTGDTVITSDMGYELRETTMDVLDRACQMRISRESTIIVGGIDSADAIKARINQIKSQIGTTASDYDHEELQERLTRMAGGMVIIHVGAATEVEMRKKKLRIKDTLNTTRAAVEEGIVAGGGTAHVNAIASMEKLLAEAESDRKTDVSTIVKAPTEPMRQITTSTGIDGSVVLENVKKADKVDYGFDTYNETYVDMISAGIIDPTKVTRSTLENAASIATTLLTTESLVADKLQPPAPAAPTTPSMGGMY